MTRDLTGKAAVVTGTAHGIGAAIAEALRADGADVYGVDKDTVDLTDAAAVRQFFQRGWGRIVNISSAAGLTVSKTGIQAYASAKAAQIGFTRQMAHELGPFGITVNCIAPGFILSNPTTERQWEGYGPDGQGDLVNAIAMRRLGDPADIANGVRFFAATRSSWVTGQTIAIDGGSALL